MAQVSRRPRELVAFRASFMQVQVSEWGQKSGDRAYLYMISRISRGSFCKVPVHIMTTCSYAWRIFFCVTLLNRIVQLTDIRLRIYCSPRQRIRDRRRPHIQRISRILTVDIPYK